MYDIIQTTLSAAVAKNGTFTVAFPTGRAAGSYAGAYAHKMTALQTVFTAPTGITLAFTTLITVTYKGETTLPAGTAVTLQVDRLGSDRVGYSPGTTKNISTMSSVVVGLGVPITADADGYFASQDLTALGVASVSTTVAAAIAAAALAGVSNTARNVVAAWTGTAVITVTGTDEYGVVVRESSGSGTSFTGKKAFKTVTAISVSADVTSLTVGTGVVLGLPVFLPGAGYIIKELLDGAAATAGTTVAGVQTAPSATTGDVRGTYNPNSAPDGTRTWRLIILLEDPTYQGLAQYGG